MQQETKLMIGQPWKIVNSFSVYEEADKKRSDIQEKNANVQVKVKRMSGGVYTVRIRPLETPVPPKKKKPSSSKDQRRDQRRKNKESKARKSSR